MGIFDVIGGVISGGFGLLDSLIYSPQEQAKIDAANRQTKEKEDALKVKSQQINASVTLAKLGFAGSQRRQAAELIGLGGLLLGGIAIVVVLKG